VVADGVRPRTGAVAIHACAPTMVPLAAPLGPTQKNGIAEKPMFPCSHVPTSGTHAFVSLKQVKVGTLGSNQRLSCVANVNSSTWHVHASRRIVRCSFSTPGQTIRLHELYVLAGNRAFLGAVLTRGGEAILRELWGRVTLPRAWPHVGARIPPDSIDQRCTRGASRST
jgi:hypothetical protein